MEKNAFTPYIVVIGLLVCTSLALAFTVDVNVTNEAGIRMNLPDQIGVWHGEDLFFCQNSQCRKSWTKDELQGAKVCPECGGELDTMALAEKRMLPGDTEIIKKRYHHPSGRSVFVSIVLSGKERVSIHRPEVCLVGQGREIVNSEVIDVPMDDRGSMGVKVLDLLIKERVGADRVVESGTYYAYWFVGKDRETPNHVARMFWMAADRIVRNVSHRWAYISVGGHRSLNDEDHKQEVKDFVRQLYPEITLIHKNI